MPNYTPISRDYKNLPSQESRGSSQILNKSRGMIVASMGLIVGASLLFFLNTPLFSNPSQTNAQVKQQNRAPLLQIEKHMRAAASESTVVVASVKASTKTQTKAQTIETRTMPLAIPKFVEIEPESTQPEFNNSHWRSVKVRKGDNLARIFKRLELDPSLLHNILTSGKKARSLKNLKPGQIIKFQFTNYEFSSLIHEISKTKHLRIDKKESDFFITNINRTPEPRISHATGIINSSLYNSAKKAGVSEKLIMDMANIFGWDIDFALDLRKGDSFIIAYEDLFLDGEKIGQGKIVAAQFINNKTTYRAVSYTTPSNKTGYFTPEGRNMRKAFLRTPVDFTRISSRFGKRRHPVLNRMRLHKGVDYAAPRGTPIRTTGDGKVLFKGRKGGYGNAIIVQHGNGKQTLYAHMSGFKRGIKRGKRIKQGQTIGFVGSTGRATGPHLHYEFRINGVHRNPLKLKFASADPVPKKLKNDFESKTSGYVALLDVVGNTSVALK